MEEQLTPYQRHYRKNRERLIARSAAQSIIKRKDDYDYVAEIKNQAACADCGVRHPGKPWRMSFDHLPGCDKVAAIGEAINKGWARKRLDAEIAKCEIVCLLCHADRTVERRGIGVKGNTRLLQG